MQPFLYTSTPFETIQDETIISKPQYASIYKNHEWYHIKNIPGALFFKIEKPELMHILVKNLDTISLDKKSFSLFLKTINNVVLNKINIFAGFEIDIKKLLLHYEIPVDIPDVILFRNKNLNSFSLVINASRIPSGDINNMLPQMAYKIFKQLVTIIFLLNRKHIDKFKKYSVIFYTQFIYFIYNKIKEKLETYSPDKINNKIYNIIKKFVDKSFKLELENQIKTKEISKMIINFFTSIIINKYIVGDIKENLFHQKKDSNVIRYEKNLINDIHNKAIEIKNELLVSFQNFQTFIDEYMLLDQPKQLSENMFIEDGIIYALKKIGIINLDNKYIPFIFISPFTIFKLKVESTIDKLLGYIL